jgi:hypothetical protein
MPYYWDLAMKEKETLLPITNHQWDEQT